MKRFPENSMLVTALERLFLKEESLTSAKFQLALSATFLQISSLEGFWVMVP